MGAIALEKRKDFIKRMATVPYKGSSGSYYLAEGRLRGEGYPLSTFNRVCYGDLKYYYHSVSELFVFHLPIKGMSTHWTNYTLNKGIYKDAFLTKSLERGYKYGFKINCDLPYNVVLGAMITLRETFNITQAKAFDLGIEAGFSEEDMIFFLSKLGAHTLRTGEGFFYPREWDSDHHPISLYLPYSSFVKGPRSDWKEGTPIKTRYSFTSMRVVKNYDHHAYYYQNNNSWLNSVYRLTGNKRSITKEAIVEMVPKIKEIFQ